MVSGISITRNKRSNTFLSQKCSFLRESQFLSSQNINLVLTRNVASVVQEMQAPSFAVQHQYRSWIPRYLESHFDCPVNLLSLQNSFSLHYYCHESTSETGSSEDRRQYPLAGRLFRGLQAKNHHCCSQPTQPRYLYANRENCRRFCQIKFTQLTNCNVTDRT